ncbi:glycosyltransferase [Chungangia koreensis]|uniref:Glycosyltransferase n=1 Tax=Chungangia koreensis TaxID=752657 RepID=A0ABV8X844_9LACT
MGGGDGLFNKEFPSFRFLESISVPIQFLIVCGKNNKLRKQLEVELINSKHHVKIFGFSENIQELMALSDLMITKPGGVSISEAMAMDLPLLIFHHLPGQEEENMEFLYRSGYAFIAKTEEDLSELINQLIYDSAPLRRMKVRIEQNHSTSSARDAIHLIVEAENRGQSPKIKNKSIVKKNLVWR